MTADTGEPQPRQNETNRGFYPVESAIVAALSTFSRLSLKEGLSRALGNIGWF